MKKYLCFLIGLLALAACTKPASTAIQTPGQRADELLSKLTLEQKVSLMRYDSPAIPELGIKAYNWWNEALHGAARAGLATVFPQAIGMASSWDDELLEQVFEAASTEQRIKFVQDRKEKGYATQYHGLTVWTPNINIFRDPRWGRGQETYGEDPYLTARMGRAVVNGLQGQPQDGYDRLHACLKHFAVHSGPESSRHRFDVQDLSYRDLVETYLYAFGKIIRSTDVQEVMGAYNRLDGKPCCANDQLLKFFLRDKWGYKGLVVSDCWAISDFFSPDGHQTFPGDPAASSAAAVLTGTDLECGDAYVYLTEAVARGQISEADIDASLRRLLIARFRLGEMDADSLVCWNRIPEDRLACDEHRALALRMARESIVLLQNDNGTLPLSRDGRYFITGPNADNAEALLGNYNGFPKTMESLRSGLERRLGPDGLAGTPGDADAILYIGGITPQMEGEEMDESPEGFFRGDRTTIEFPGWQRAEIEELAQTGKPIVLINLSGSAMGLEPESGRCGAIIQAWYGGEAAPTALADILLGDVNPSGKLPVTFYRNDSELPDFEDYDMAGHTYRYYDGTPLWCFGHGLSYTTFEYGPARIRRGNLTFKLSNTGAMDGCETVQLYVRKAEDEGGPRMALRSFQRVNVPAGRSVTVAIPLTDEVFETFDAESGDMLATPGHFTLLYGPSSDPALLQSLEITRE